MNPSLCSMDAAGRLVLPKPVRDRLNLGSGSQLEISELADGVLLRPVDARPTLTREHGLVIHEGHPGAPLTGAVERLRNERLDSLKP